jgi:hypothetical protein
MTARDGGASPGDEELRRLRSPATIRSKAAEILRAAERDELEHFAVRLEALPRLTARVVDIARGVYPDLAAVPVHGRYRHFLAGRLDRLALLDARLAGASEREKLVARADLVITSVLLDAGAGGAWSYREGSRRFDRSEGLAVASFAWFASGGLSADPLGAPLRADALGAVDGDALRRAFQSSEDNPLLGVDGRVALLRGLAAALSAHPRYFGTERPRPGNLALALLDEARDGRLPAPRILEAVLDSIGSIWPGRESLHGVPLGDVWTHSRFGRVPFHKLSQWLSYSLFEPLEQAGVRVTDAGELTGLAEYRNGGLFVDGGVIVPKHPAVVRDMHAVGSDVIIEWRALTVALLDRLADAMRVAAGLSAEALPLAKVLEAGTWRAGRVLALENRPGGAPPVRVDSDGTVF